MRILALALSLLIASSLTTAGEAQYYGYPRYGYPGYGYPGYGYGYAHPYYYGPSIGYGWGVWGGGWGGGRRGFGGGGRGGFGGGVPMRDQEPQILAPPSAGASRPIPPKRSKEKPRR